MKKSDGEYPNYWIDPYGVIYEVDMMGHTSWAFDYLEKEKGFDFFHIIRNKTGIDGPTEYLESIGWKRVLTWPSGPTHFITSNNIVRWSKKQKESVFKICMDEDLDYPKWMID